MKKGACALVLILALLVTVTGCRPRTILAVAGLQSLSGLTLVDRADLSVPVPDPAPFTEAFLKATVEPRGRDLNLALATADYRLVTGDTRFYYFLDRAAGVRGHLVYVDGRNRQHVYRAELDALILGVWHAARPPLPAVPGVQWRVGAPNQEIAAWALALSEVKHPVAYLLEHGEDTVMVFAAGPRTGTTYTVRVHEMARVDETLVVTFRIEGPSPPISGAVSHPHTVLTFDGRVGQVVARTTDGRTVQEWPVIPMTADQNVVLLHPLAGSLLTGRVTLTGKARVAGGELSVEIEDGHNLLAQASFRVTRAAPVWGDFEVQLQLRPHTNLSGAIIFFTGSAQAGNRQELLVVPVVFAGGK